MKISESKLQELITFRRAIHSHPELMFEETKTAELVSEHLTKLNLNFEKGIAKTGITCLLDSGIPGKTLLVRADMDALPIHEENQVSYRSRNTGIMHACGHDGHTAILMSLAGDLKAQISSLMSPL
jgi:amidohydrolase